MGDIIRYIFWLVVLAVVIAVSDVLVPAWNDVWVPGFVQAQANWINGLVGYHPDRAIYPLLNGLVLAVVISFDLLMVFLVVILAVEFFLCKLLKVKSPITKKRRLHWAKAQKAVKIADSFSRTQVLAFLGGDNLVATYVSVSGDGWVCFRTETQGLIEIYYRWMVSPDKHGIVIVDLGESRVPRVSECS